MIILHSSSRCDVCLDPYSWNTTSDTPHAIPCGHIFCKACLRTLSPSLCPLCRKDFHPDRAKRLHVDRPPENTGFELELDFLQRLALVSGDHTHSENVEEVTTEVQNWLTTQLLDSNLPLRAACDAILRHRALRGKYARDKTEHKNVRRKLRQEAAHDQRTARAVEERLLHQLQELENEYTMKIEKLENEIAELRSENERYRRTSNPLPPPPKPLPVDRFPPFVAASLVANSSTSSQPASHPNIGVPKVSHNLSEGAPYVNGYVGPSGKSIQATTASAVKSDAARTSDRESGSSEAGQRSKQFRFGSRRTRIYASQRTAPSPPLPPPPPPPAPPVPPPQPHNHHSHSTHRLYPYARSQSDSDYIYRNGIIPGAPPAQRIIPPPPRWPDTTMNPMHKPEPANRRGWGEMIGQLGQDGESSNSRAAARTARNMATVHPPPVLRNATVEVPKYYAPAAAFVSGYGYGLESGYAFVNEYPTTSDGRGRSHQVHASPTQQEEEPTGGLGLMNVPAPRPPGSVSPETNGILHRHISTGTASRANVQDGSQGGTYRTSHRRQESGVEQPGAVRDSRSSWGTVEAGEGNSMRGSMSELGGLIGLHGVTGGMRELGSTTESFLTTPVRLGHENGFVGADSVPNVPRRDVEDDEEEDEDDADSDENEDDAPRMLSREAVQGHNQRRNSDHRRSNSQDQLASNPSTPTLFSRSVGGASRSSGEIGNALALDFNPSLSSLDISISRPRSPPNVSESHITAPTPIVSRRNVMSDWRLENE